MIICESQCTIWSLILQIYHDCLINYRTDEQAPIPNVFDQLIARVQIMNQNDDALFNCQMGRGRTTTGMVIAMMLKLVESSHGNHETLSELLLENSKLEELFIDEGDEPMEHGYKRGEYRIIIKLLAVLGHGKLAKGLADHAIDKCEQVQNLRQAIFDFKTRLLAVQNNLTRKYLDMAEVAINYLMRYFYLITFADYLLESYSVGYENLTFVEWLSSHQEIVHLTKIDKLNPSIFE